MAENTRVIVILVDEDRAAGDGGQESAESISRQVKEIVERAHGHNYSFDELKAGPTVAVSGLDDLIKRGAGAMGLAAHYWRLSPQ